MKKIVSMFKKKERNENNMKYVVELNPSQVEVFKTYNSNVELVPLDDYLQEYMTPTVEAESAPVEVSPYDLGVQLEKMEEPDVRDIEIKELKDKLAQYEKYDDLIEKVEDLRVDGVRGLHEEIEELKAYKEKVKSLLVE